MCKNVTLNFECILTLYTDLVTKIDPCIGELTGDPTVLTCNNKKCLRLTSFMVAIAVQLSGIEALVIL